MIMQGVTFNTTMALVAGTIMILAVVVARTAARAQAAVPGKARTLTGWGWAFVALGAYLGVTGMYMTLMWPLKEVDGAFCCTVDNVTFGEPAALYGLLTFIAGLAIIAAQKAADRKERPLDLVGTLRPILYVAAVGGVGLVMFAIAGMHFGMWRPPDIEPIARLMAGQIWEPLMVMCLYGFSGIAAMLAPFAPENKWVGRIATLLTWGCGVTWVFLSFTVFYSHVGFFPPA